ncbi:hypothetical protein IMCC9480_3695 [Oxalobacteraceae bacterium IMCC9480]|nr:hypothetical protein IMCC9480_3695 [Oxalobacteraceae bacterium IMCC9480]
MDLLTQALCHLKFAVKPVCMDFTVHSSRLHQTVRRCA